MEAQSRSQSLDYYRKGEVSGGEKQGGTLSDFTGLSGTDVCGTLVSTEKGGAIMKMTPEQDYERREGLSQERQKIVDMIERISDPQLLDRIYRFIKYIYIHRT